jgi:hypothetical protein
MEGLDLQDRLLISFHPALAGRRGAPPADGTIGGEDLRFIQGETGLEVRDLRLVGAQIAIELAQVALYHRQPTTAFEGVDYAAVPAPS